MTKSVIAIRTYSKGTFKTPDIKTELEKENYGEYIFNSLSTRDENS